MNKIIIAMVVAAVFAAGMPLASADKTVTIDKMPAGEFTVTPSPLYINTGERVTFHVTDNAIVQCSGGASFSVSINANDNVFPSDSDFIRFNPTSANSDFTTGAFEWPSSVSTSTYSVSGYCAGAISNVFDIQAEFRENFIIQPACIVTESCGWSFSFPDECELVSGDPCIPDLVKEWPEHKWGPVCLTCPPDIQTQLGLIYDAVLDQKVSSLGMAVENIQLENKVIIGLLTVSIALGIINLARHTRQR